MIDNPQNPIALPSDIAAEVEKAKKQIAINKQEIITLQKTRLSEEYTIREILKTKDELAAENSRLENLVASGIEKSTAIQAENVKKMNENKKLELLNSELTAQIKEKQERYIGKEAELGAREDKLKLLNTKLEEEKIELRNKEVKLTAFAGELKAVISRF